MLPYIPYSLLISALVNSNKCPNILPMKNLNTSEYIRSTWYIQKQQITGYQPANSLYCVAQTLNVSKRTVPFYSGNVIDVYNYGRLNGINGTSENSNNFTLCARQVNKNNTGEFLNGLCSLPNIFTGPYWVLNAGPNNSLYEWAIVSGGAPTVRYPDGNCSTSLKGTNGSGLWLFTRSKSGYRVKAYTDYMQSYLVNMGITISQLLNVTQTGCNYKGNYIKF